MILEQIANFWTQLSSRMAAPWATAPRGLLERAGSNLDGDPIDAVNGERPTEPYVPANNERVSESSLHLSC
jgi:hypothetical protein